MRVSGSATKSQAQSKSHVLGQFHAGQFRAGNSYQQHQMSCRVWARILPSYTKDFDLFASINCILATCPTWSSHISALFIHVYTPFHLKAHFFASCWRDKQVDSNAVSSQFSHARRSL